MLATRFHGSQKPVCRAALAAAAQEVLSQQPLFTSVDYISIADKDTLEELERVGDAGAVVSVAVQLGRTRLIDSIIL
jgi:pantoate--beta-alanine ligase